MKRIGFAGVFAALFALVLSPLPAQAARGGQSGGGGGGTPAGTFSCRASVVRVEPAGLLSVLNPVELFVANPNGNPCVDDTSGLANALVQVNGGALLNLSAELLVSRTDGGTQGGVAHAGVGNLTLTVLGQQIGVSILTAEATGGPCPATALQSESTVAALTINGASVTVPAGHGEIGIEVLGLGVLTLHLNEKILGNGQVTQRALWLESDLIGDVIVAEAVADVHGNPCTVKPPKPPREPHGFMTGGGSIQTTAAGRVTHGAHLVCVPSEGPNNLQVNWAGHRFHLESVTSTANTCRNDPAIDPGKPAATFDTIEGDGAGRCNGNPATVHWKLTDAGEPGGGDRFEVRVDGGPSCQLNVAGTLSGGNHQAHSKS